MLRLLGHIFGWWTGMTIGGQWTLFWRRARFIGADDYGNRYFEERRASLEGRKRRYVAYNGYADASRVPSDWHGWLHHTFPDAPTDAPLPRKPWETDHRPNLTGTVNAYRPSGSITRGGERQRATGDYEPWTPEKD